jgi:hypothetical protein
VDIASGQSESHPTPAPLDQAAHPGVQQPTQIFPSGSEQGRVRDVTADRLTALAAGEAAARQAMSTGMSQDGARREHYESSTAPLGASAGDQLVLPELPGYVVPPPPWGGYEFSGDEPVPA